MQGSFSFSVFFLISLKAILFLEKSIKILRISNITWNQLVGTCNWNILVNNNCSPYKYSHISTSLPYSSSFLIDWAIKGKGAKSVVGRLAPSLDLSKMNFMTGTDATVAGSVFDCSGRGSGYWQKLFVLVIRNWKLPSDEMWLHRRRRLRNIRQSTTRR